MNPDLKILLPDELQARLNVIIQRIPLYWELKRYNHFTNHGVSHSERVYRSKLAYLAQELPEKKRLTADEIFIVSAASWLYEVGMQSPYLEPTLTFNNETKNQLTFSDLQQIRANKHILSERLIMGDYDGQALSLGLVGQRDEYEKAIAKVCRYISDDPIDQVPETLAVKGMPVRLRLLVALLRLADQLYIDSTRIAPDLLQNANIPLENLAYWWMFNYVQTLPISNGQIPFSYFLPLSQREYLNHIRGFVESRFEYEKNPVIKCLWNEYELKLMPSKSPTVQFDQYQSSHFQNLLSENLIYFLRQGVKPVTNGEGNFQHSETNLLSTNNILILDYENFIYQLGQEGFLYSQEETYRFLLSLLSEAKKKFGGSIDGYAIGHWDRPDLREVGSELKKRTYNLITLNTIQNDVDIVDGFLKNLNNGTEMPANLILVTPSPDYALLTKKYQSSRSMVTAWLSGLPDAAVFQITAHKYNLVSDILGLKKGEANPLEYKSLIERSCILRIDDELRNKSPDGLSNEEITGCLGQVLGNTKNHLWWKLWLINNNILITKDQATFFINSESPEVKHIFSLRSHTIRAFVETTSIEPLSLNNNALFAKLRPQFTTEHEITEFLTILKDEDIIRRELKPSDEGDLISWHINSYHWALIAEYPQKYLTIFILALDQVLVRDKYPYLHEHSLKNKLTPYFGSQNIFNFVYQLAGKENIVSLQAGQGSQEDNPICVSLNPESSFVCETLRNRDILLNGLRKKSFALPPIQANMLYQKLSSVRSFSVKKSDLNIIINVLRKDKILIVPDHETDQNVIQLNIDDDLVKRFLGRLYVYGIIRSLRLMGCTRIENKKSKRDVMENISRYVTSNDNSLAEWALDFSQGIKLVICENKSTESETLYLNNHSFIRHLDRKEQTVVKALLCLVQSLRCDAEGWIPRHVIIRSMERDYIFGYSIGENEYWLDQSIHARQWRVLEEKKIRIDGALQSFIRSTRR